MSLSFLLQFYKKEAKAIAGANIIVATPGRLLQHMSETPYFTADNLKYLGMGTAYMYILRFCYSKPWYGADSKCQKKKKKKKNLLII